MFESSLILPLTDCALHGEPSLSWVSRARTTVLGGSTCYFVDHNMGKVNVDLRNMGVQEAKENAF